MWIDGHHLIPCFVLKSTLKLKQQRAGPIFSMKCLLCHIISNTGRTQKVSVDRFLNCWIDRHYLTVSDHKMLERWLYRWYGKEAWIDTELVHKQQIVECMFLWYLAQWGPECGRDIACFQHRNAYFQLKMALRDVRVWKHSYGTHRYIHRGFGLLWHLLGIFCFT